ncbi:MAG TPA: tRNA pseudouridine(38-40) synthase TruA [Bacilli bacterium]|nr:tRNA pseudouridine(38-40) synthase TruA [Bacilli bacterium]
MRYKAVVKYVGANYYGWQKQLKETTVQGVIEHQLSRIFNQDIVIHGSGRTDRYVHAYGQVFHFDAPSFPLRKLRYSLNKMLPESIEILKLNKAADNFHARLDAKSKTYEYIIIEKAKDPFNAPYSLLYPFPLSLSKLIEAANYFIGKHNFQNFTNKEEDYQGFVREIQGFTVKRSGKRYTFIIQGNGFMRGQIRMMIGTILAYNENKLTLNEIKSALESTERNIISYKVKGHGLYLRKVEY